MDKTPKRIAVVLFNLGGPDGLEAVQPFLLNLFSDKSILRLPNPFRAVLANVIARKRAPEARKIYSEIGGRSPLLPNTQAQAAALEDGLKDCGEVRVFLAMRYWHPMSDEAVMQVQDFAPDQVVLLPLYPQYSTTTTASSLRVWREAAQAFRFDCRTHVVCCYPWEGGFIDALAGLIRPRVDEAAQHGRPRVLFSAHGLPEKIVKAGDPYQWQCERTAAAIVRALAIDGLDWVSCYQSRVGPLKWIGPSTEEEVERAGRDRVPLVVVPIAFVSDHSETLVELDIEYRHLAERCGVPYYARVATVGTAEAFVAALRRLVLAAIAADRPMISGEIDRLCPADWAGCPMDAAAGRM
ncbi:MAG: ferrochelatase [Rhodospirillaceae bacterium]|nr:ferrochelatase [Rhodospirillaceae bacterium]